MPQGLSEDFELTDGSFIDWGEREMDWQVNQEQGKLVHPSLCNHSEIAPSVGAV